MRLLRELYLSTLIRRLNDISDEFANPASHTVDLFLGICFESCKLNQVWNNFIRNDIILWDETHTTRRENHGSVNNQMCIREFSRATRNWPSEGATLQRQIRSNYRVLTDWNCCTRVSCPLQEQGRFDNPRTYEDHRGLRWRVNTDWNKIGGPPRYRREPVTLSAIGAAVLIGAVSGAVGGGITSFAMSSAQQSKINEEVAKLSTLVGELSNVDQNQWSNQKNINMEFLKDREDFVQRIEETLCSASATHTKNERKLEESSLKIQYQNSLSAVVRAITTRRITPEIIPVSSLRKKLAVPGSLYENDILAAYSLGRIHHNIYRLDESLIFLIVFPTPLSNVFTLYMPITLPIKSDYNSWSKISYPDHTRMIIFKNVTYIISISGWTNQDQLVIFESDYLKTNISGLTVSTPAPKNNHISHTTLYGMWTVCNQIATLYKWEITYGCEQINYTTPNELDSLSLVKSFENVQFVQQTNYQRISNSSNLNKLLDEQEVLISNRSIKVKALMEQINSLIAATKEGTGLFGDISRILLNLLPTSWATTIKQLIFIIALIISLPIIFFVVIISLRCLRLMICCYRPLCLCFSSFSVRSIVYASSLVSKTTRLLSRCKSRNAGQHEPVDVHYSALSQNEIQVKPRTNRLKVKKATSKIV